MAKVELAHDAHIHMISVDLYKMNAWWEYSPSLCLISGSVVEI
jgi:hypothetical protein